MYGDRKGSHFGGGFRERQGGFNRGGPRFAPVKVGDELDVKIESVGAKGDGVARVKGFVLFVPGTQEGQEVKVRVTRVLRKVGFAEVVGEATGPVGEESQEQAEEPVEEFGEEPAEEEPVEEFGEKPAKEAPAEEEPADEPEEEENKEE